MIVIAIFLFSIFFSLLLLVKNNVTYHNYIILTDAIANYQKDLVDKGKYDLYGNNPVEFDDMESYDKSLFRLWDWGYENILPKEKYEIIKPYI